MRITRHPAMRVGFPVVVTALAATLCACGGDAGGGESDRRDDSAKVRRPAIQTQSFNNPCDWVSQADVEQVIGKLASPPRLGRNAESPRPDDEGAACVYSVPGDRVPLVDVAVQVDLNGSPGIEQADDMLGATFAKELADDGSAAAPAKKRVDGWDYVGGMGVSVWRVGHVAVQIGGNSIFLMPSEKVSAIAALVRDRIRDLPFALPGADPNAAGSAPDPCALLTRAEAEAALGGLVVEPFRSRESSPLADGEGPSCTYFTRGHRALVVTPTRSDGKMMFGMVSGIGGLVRSTVGGADSADLLEGPWDQAASSSASGSLYFLKGDQMLEVSYLTSSTDLAGATELARTAITRL